MHLSDLHLGWPAGFLGERAAVWAQERDDVLQKAVDLALSPCESVDGVIIAGDLFEHHRPPVAVVEAALRQLSRLTQGGKFLLTVPGNHDEISYHDSVYRQYAEHWPGSLVTQPNPAHVGSYLIRGETVHFYGLAYQGGITRCEVPLADLPRQDVPGIHIGVFHGSLDCPVTWRSLPLSSKELAKAAYDYVALGHFHQATWLELGPTVVSYCGAIAGKGFDDKGTGRIQLVDLSSSGARLRSVPLSLRPQRIQILDLDEVQDEQALRSWLDERQDIEAMVRVVLRGTAGFADAGEKVSAYAAGLFYYCEVADQTMGFSPAYLAEIARETSVRGYFARRLLAEAEAAPSVLEKQVCLQALRVGLGALGKEWFGGGGNF